MHNKCEKYLIRKAFDLEKPLLPKEVLWRQKEAFSDGVSSLNRSWYNIIDEKILEKYGKTYDVNSDKVSFLYNTPKTREQNYYRTIFASYFKQEKTIPYFWMPKFVNASDSSARTLKVYNEK